MLELKHRDVLDKLRDGILNNDITEVLEKVAAELVIKYQATVVRINLDK